MKHNATIFDFLEDILVKKTGEMPLDQYVPYIVTRWLSFVDPTVAEFVNSANKQVLLENKEMHYKMMLSMFPKMRRLPRLSYVKKAKEEKKEEDNTVTLLAAKHELSEREVEQMLGFLDGLNV